MTMTTILITLTFTFFFMVINYYTLKNTNIKKYFFENIRLTLNGRDTVLFYMYNKFNNSNIVFINTPLISSHAIVIDLSSRIKEIIKKIKCVEIDNILYCKFISIKNEELNCSINQSGIIEECNDEIVKFIFNESNINNHTYSTSIH